MERTYESAAELVGRATGPLVSHLVPFVTIVDRSAVRGEHHLYQGTARTSIRPLAREAGRGVSRSRRSTHRALPAPEPASTSTHLHRDLAPRVRPHHTTGAVLARSRCLPGGSYRNHSG